MKLMTVTEVAEFLRCGESTVRGLIDRGDIVCFKIGPNNGGIRIAESDVLTYLESCRQNGKPKKKSRLKTPRLRHLRLS